MHGVDVLDIRHFWPNDRPLLDGAAVTAVLTHHDGVLMAAGDVDYSGSTLDEDLERIDAIHRHSEAEGWGAFPYHLAASPNGRLFFCRDLDRRGSHIYRRNHETLGVVALGNFMSMVPGYRQVRAVGAGVALAVREVGRDVEWPGHREYAVAEHPTSCPGDSWESWRPAVWWWAGMLVGEGANVKPYLVTERGSDFIWITNGVVRSYLRRMAHADSLGIPREVKVVPRGTLGSVGRV